MRRRDILRHTAGMTNALLTPTSPVAQLYAEAGIHDPTRTLAEAVDALAKLPLLRQPGTIWDDSIATDALARVVEIASGQPFAQFVAREITTPLRMADTAYIVANSNQARTAQPRIDPLTGALPSHQDMTGPPARWWRC